MPAVWDVADLRARVQAALDEFLSRRQPELDAIGTDLRPFTAALSDLLAGGKRLRPAFCYWGWRGAGGADGPAIIAAAAALELVQACALIHDDVMDGSDTRRGMPAAHRRFAATHRERAWTGSHDNFGTGAAILLGDLALAWADQMLFDSGLPAQALLGAKWVYDLMRAEIMAGQYLDLLEQARGGGNVESALRVMRFKSAKYTIERPLHLGAALAGGDARLMAAFSAYGLPLGEAFQLRDDILGVFGDPAQTGKPAGDDLREGKRTALVAMALEQADPEQVAVVRHHLGDPYLDTAGVTALRGVIRDTGALARAEQMVTDLTGRALAALDGAVLAQPARAVLIDLAEAATSRTG